MRLPERGIGGALRGVPLLIGVLLAALAVAGCGGGGETIAKSVPRPVFLERAEEICEQTEERIQTGYGEFARRREGRPIDDVASVRRYAETVLIPAKERQVEMLRALGAPPEDEDQIEAILVAYEEGIEKAEDSPSLAVTASQGVFVRSTELAEAYGLDKCIN